MNKIDKFLNKLSVRERDETLEWMERIKRRDFEGLHIKKLKGFDNLYRVRIGKIRIIFYWKDTIIEIVKIDRRNDNTYNF